jgi:hypothetical protein
MLNGLPKCTNARGDAGTALVEGALALAPILIFFFSALHHNLWVSCGSGRLPS